MNTYEMQRLTMREIFGMPDIKVSALFGLMIASIMWLMFIFFSTFSNVELIITAIPLSAAGVTLYVVYEFLHIKVNFRYCVIEDAIVRLSTYKR